MNLKTTVVRGALPLCLALALMILAPGCGRDTSAPPSAEQPSAVMPATPAPVVDLDALEPFEIDAAAPTVDETHRALASAGLVHARLMDLPEGLLLRSEGVTIQMADLERELAAMPAAMRDQWRAQSFHVLEQIATRELLADEARAAGLAGGDDNARIQALLEREARAATVTDEDVRAFYEANREMVGDASFEQIADQLRAFLLQEKEQEQVHQYVLDLARRSPVAVSADWTARQAEAARDNPIDRARASGKPTLVSFGADKCMPCRAMAPARAAVASKYEGIVNVVYIRVDEQQVLSSRYGVRGIPHLIFFDAEGKQDAAHTGMMSQEEMEAHLARLGAVL